jgi:hypothetical protein
MKSKSGKFVKAEFKEVVSKGWDGKIVVVHMGSEENPASVEELEETVQNLSRPEVTGMLNNTNFLITAYNIDFEVLGSVEDLKKQRVLVHAKVGDDLSKLGDLQKEARRQLRQVGVNTAVLPTPMSVEEYHEVMKIKKRCDIRKRRRGR